MSAKAHLHLLKAHKHTKPHVCATCPERETLLRESARLNHLLRQAGHARSHRTDTDQALDRLFRYVAHLDPGAPRSSIDPYQVETSYPTEDLRTLRDELMVLRARLSASTPGPEAA